MLPEHAQLCSTPSFTLAHFEEFLGRRAVSSATDRSLIPDVLRSEESSISLTKFGHLLGFTEHLPGGYNPYTLVEDHSARVFQLVKTRGTSARSERLPRGTGSPLTYEMEGMTMTPGVQNRLRKPRRRPILYCDPYFYHATNCSAECTCQFDIEEMINRSKSKLPPNQLLPLIPVRAHYIDTCLDPLNLNIIQFFHELRTVRDFASASNWPWLLDLCCTPTKSPFPNGVSQQDTFKDTFNMRAFRRLVQEMTQVAAGSRAGTLFPFLTRRSVGLTRGYCAAGDRVFLVEGVEHPLLLRHVRAKGYRVVCKVLSSSY